MPVFIVDAVLFVKALDSLRVSSSVRRSDSETKLVENCFIAAVAP